MAVSSQGGSDHNYGVVINTIFRPAEAQLSVSLKCTVGEEFFLEAVFDHFLRSQFFHLKAVVFSSTHVDLRSLKS